MPPNLGISHSYSESPSSQGSDTIGTPPTDNISHNGMGKRPASHSQFDPRKRPRKEEPEDSNANSPEESKPKSTRGSRACTVCRRLKMKCVGAEHGPPCKRCQTGNHDCVFEESNRGKRSTNSSNRKHEQLTKSLRRMERTLDTVLRSIGNPSITSGMISRSPSPSNQAAGTQALLDGDSPPGSPRQQHVHNQRQPIASTSGTAHRSSSPKLHSLPDNSLNPLGLLAEASLANRRAQGSHLSSLIARPADNDSAAQKVGVASDNYFKPGPMTILPLRRLYIERQVQPEMLSFVETETVIELFNIFFDHMNMHCSLLDRDFHTPSLVCSRSPFLLTTICAISSKFYTPKPELHYRLTDIAKKLAFGVPAQGYKSVEIVQAYLLLALWGCGAVERFEQDKTWMLLGMAIRMGTDLNLHRKTATSSSDTEESRARDVEVHNRERTWILCYCLDRSFSAQMGKPYSIREDYIICNVNQFLVSPCAIPTDASLGSYLELQRILSRSLDVLYSSVNSPSGLQLDIDYLMVTRTIETQLYSWMQVCGDRIRQHVNVMDPQMMQYKMIIVQFYYNYAMLVVNSFGLQNALDRSSVDITHFFARCHSAAMKCATLVRDELGPKNYLKYSPDSHLVMTSYAVLSLLKLVRQEFQPFLENEPTTIELVRNVADVLESIAATPTHTPALYSTFLRVLISAKMEKPSNPDRSSAGTPGMRGQGEMPPPSMYNHRGVKGNDQDPTMNGFHFNGEMGPVADMSTFPPTMAPSNGTGDDEQAYMSMDSILSTNFWDNVLVPGYSNSMDALSGGFVFGAGGSGLITPRVGGTPIHSGSNTPVRQGQGEGQQFSQHIINNAFNDQR